MAQVAEAMKSGLTEGIGMALIELKEMRKRAIDAVSATAVPEMPAKIIEPVTLARPRPPPIAGPWIAPMLGFLERNSRVASL